MVDLPPRPPRQAVAPDPRLRPVVRPFRRQRATADRGRRAQIVLSGRVDEEKSDA